MGAYAELTVPDPRTGRFMPGGLSTDRLLTADSTVEYQRSLIADATLVDAVPEGVRDEFEKLRTLHVHGAIRYENFTDVCNTAPGLYECALQARFLDFYADRPIPFVSKTGESLAMDTPARADFQFVFQKVKLSRGLRLRASSGSTVWFNGMLDGLLKWARAENLLRGQRARRFEASVQRERNEIAHGRRYLLEMPLQSVQAIRDLAEFTNQLWGTPTAGGRRYQTGVTRHVLAIGIDEDGNTDNVPAQELFVSADTAGWRWIIVRSAHGHGGPIEFDLRFAATETPVEYLWGPGDTADAIAWIAHHEPAGDVVDTADQLLLIRTFQGVLYAPRYPETALALPTREQAGNWQLVLADHPFAVMSCAYESGLNQDHKLDCRCPVSTLARGSWRRMLHRLAELRPELFSVTRPFPRPLPTQLPPDARIEGFEIMHRTRVIESNR